MRILPTLCICLLVFACTSAPSRPPAPGHACCPVCECEGDLACVDVTVHGDTPTVEFGGRKFYFCSDECRCRFERAPQRYAAAH